MSDFWDREAVERRHIEWMAPLPVRLHINELIGGDGQRKWAIEWFEWWLRGRKFERALSVGCGTGELDRQLVGRGLCRLQIVFGLQKFPLCLLHGLFGGVDAGLC